MKAKYFLLVILLVSFTAFAQQVKVPKVVKDSFSKLYPKVTDVKWDKENKDFEVSFKFNGKDMSVIFDNDAKVLETETAIEISQLPRGIDKYVSDQYKAYKISGAAKIVKANGEVLFEAEISKGKEKKDLLFDSKGNPEKKDVNKENEEEDEKD